MATVTVSQISKRFGDVQAVSDVSFEVHPGEIFGLLGPNGAGKTTTIRIVLDIFRADRGEVTVFGGKLDEASKNHIGYMPEERGLYQDQKLEPTLVYLATLKGLDSGTARSRLAHWLERLDLYEHRNKKVQELSKGMQQKAQLIATLLHDPDLIVVDEPFAGLDPVNTRLVNEIMEEQRQAGKTILMSTHQMYQVEALCNRIVLINRGRAVLYGEVDQIRHDFAGNAISWACRECWRCASRTANGVWLLPQGPSHKRFCEPWQRGKRPGSSDSRSLSRRWTTSLSRWSREIRLVPVTPTARE